MNSLFPIFMEKSNKDGSTSLRFQNYRVYYDYERMQNLLENIKLQYSQTYRDYGAINDINSLQDFSVIDLFKAEVDVKGRYGAPDIYRYRYIRYPAIYKILLNSLTNETFSLDIFANYYEQLKQNREISLYYNPTLIACLSNKTVEEIEQSTYLKKHVASLKFYNDKELKITIEEYKKILKGYLSLIKLRYEASKTISKNAIKLADLHREFLVYNDLFDDTLIAKKFRKL